MASTTIPTASAAGNARGKIDIRLGEIEIFSCFDSGNLDRVEQSQVPLEYKLWTTPDCAGTIHENGNRTWFYFGVRIPQNYANKSLRFHVQNLNKQSRLYQQRMVPIFRTVPGKSVWERLRGNVEWQMGEEGLILSFEYVISSGRIHSVYFAFCYPFSYSECQHKLNYLDRNYMYGIGNKNIYYHRELMCYSLEGRRVDLLTISSLDGRTENREPRLEGLFPDTSIPRAHCFRGKKIVIVSSRVHPGETPSSHVFNGLLEFLLRDNDERAEAVRRNFVVKMIPMLNPDGVAHGHYRTDTRGINLNRVYNRPDPKLHPSIFAARSLILHHYNKIEAKPIVMNHDLCMCNSQRRVGSAKVQLNSKNTLLLGRSRSQTYPVDNRYVNVQSLRNNGGVLHTCVCQNSRQGSNQSPKNDIIESSSKGGVAMYVDLHAHATKRGCFFYGNFLNNEQDQVENMLYPRLVAINSPHLDFEHCLFSEKNMHATDKRDGMSKEGSGRVALYTATGLIHSYTLECNYNSGRQSNAVSAVAGDNGRLSPELPYSPMPQRYNIASFEQVGRALAIALLDLHNLNPWSRLPTSESGSLAALRASLALRIKTSRAKARRERSWSSPTWACTKSTPEQSIHEPQECHSSGRTSPITCSSMRRRLRPSPQLVTHLKSNALLKKREQIALDVSQLTELKRIHRYQSDMAKPLPSSEADGSKCPRIKNVVFPNTMQGCIDTQDSYKAHAPKKNSPKKQYLLPKRASNKAEESHCSTATSKMNKSLRCVKPPSSYKSRTPSKYVKPPS